MKYLHIDLVDLIKYDCHDNLNIDSILLFNINLKTNVAMVQTKYFKKFEAYYNDEMKCCLDDSNEFVKIYERNDTIIIININHINGFNIYPEEKWFEIYYGLNSDRIEVTYSEELFNKVVTKLYK